MELQSSMQPQLAQFEAPLPPIPVEYAPESPAWKTFMDILKVSPNERSEEHIQEMISFLQQMPIFELEPPSRKLLDHLSVETYRKEVLLHEVSLQENSQKDFFFILTGNITVTKSDRSFSYTISSGYTFGEINISQGLQAALHQEIHGYNDTTSRYMSPVSSSRSNYGKKQKADSVQWLFKTSQAEETVVLKLPLQVYAQELLPRWEKELEKRCRILLRLHVPLFAKMESGLYLELVKQLRRHVVKARTVICKQNAIASTMYFIISGECKVLKHLTFEEMKGRETNQFTKFLELATYKPREYFGELVLLNYDISRMNPAKRECSVYAVSGECELLSLNYQTFATFFSEWMISIMEEFASGYPDAAEISQLFIKRAKWTQYKQNLLTKLTRSNKVKIR